MSSRLVTTLRVVAGAIVGAIAGAIIVLVVATGISSAIGNQGGWALGFVMTMWGVPIAIVVGAVLGGWAAGAGRASGIFRFAAVVTMVLVGLAIVLSIVLPDNRPRPVVDAKGCTIAPRVGSFGRDERYVVVYDRYCSGGEGHTVNVSAVPTARDSIVGPGNMLVLAGELEGVSPSGVAMYADIHDSTHVLVRFDHRAHVLAQSSPVLGFEVVLRPDIGLPPQPVMPPEPPPEVKAMIEAQREMIRTRGASTPGSPAVADADGCLIHPQLTLDKHGRHFTVYDRVCASAPQRTMNVSLTAPDAPLSGVGNVLVLDLAGAPEKVVTGRMLPVWLDLPDPHHLAIRYDDQFRVVSQGLPVDDLDITVQPHRRGAP